MYPRSGLSARLVAILTGIFLGVGALVGGPAGAQAMPAVALNQSPGTAARTGQVADATQAQNSVSRAKKAAAKRAAAKKDAAKRAAAKKKAAKRAAAKKTAAKRAAAKKTAAKRAAAKKKAKSATVKRHKKAPKKGPSTTTPQKQATAAPQNSTTTEPSSPTEPTVGIASAPGGKWMSGAAGDGVADGSFAAWRGSAVPIAGTWADTFEAQTEMWVVLPGSDYGSWQGDLDIAVGAIWQNKGETWAAAATGAYDARWRLSLRTLATAWGQRPGTLHIRFAHEFNGDWVPWKVPSSETGSFIAAWKRFRALQKEVVPKAKLVFCPNVDSSRSLSLDWRKAFPGAAFVDEMSVDSYNDWPYVNTAAGFASKINMTDSHGAPAGIEKHRLFAASLGLPLAISEWSSNSADGDGDAYMRLFYDWVAAHAGTGAGQVPYEIIFNVGYFKNGLYQVFPKSAMPKAADAYRAIF